ncbi:hypothetical protein [Muricoccus radiodurans]|uniref:hypothetical protein n=1 Tax=Muricoccus radiodurans TaxID=2231721 RepID=UPI003CEEAF8B
MMDMLHKQRLLPADPVISLCQTVFGLLERRLVRFQRKILGVRAPHHNLRTPGCISLLTQNRTTQ